MLTLLADVGGSFTVGPNPWLVLFTAYMLLVLPAAAIVTARKGHWAWLLAGLLLGGLPVLFAAFLDAKPGSAWARRSRRRRSAAGA